jgi:hypothetical protein
MADPSDYELMAWRDIQRFKGRRLSRVMGNASEQVAVGAAVLGKRATKHLGNHPRASVDEERAGTTRPSRHSRERVQGL